MEWIKLRADPRLRVIHIDPAHATAMEQLAALRESALVYDCRTIEPDVIQAIHVPHPRIPTVGLGGRGRPGTDAPGPGIPAGSHGEPGVGAGGDERVPDLTGFGISPAGQSGHGRYVSGTPKIPRKPVRSPHSSRRLPVFIWSINTSKLNMIPLK